MESFLIIGYSTWGRAQSVILFLTDALILTLASLGSCFISFSDILYQLAQSIA